MWEEVVEDDVEHASGDVARDKACEERGSAPWTKRDRRAQRTRGVVPTDVADGDVRVDGVDESRLWMVHESARGGYGEGARAATDQVGGDGGDDSDNRAPVAATGVAICGETGLAAYSSTGSARGRTDSVRVVELRAARGNRAGLARSDKVARAERTHGKRAS